MHVFHVFPPIDKAIHDAAGPAKVRRKREGGHGRGRGEQPTNATIPRETIVAIRAASEVERLPLRQVQKRFSSLPAKYVRDVIDYVVRTNTR